MKSTQKKSLKKQSEENQASSATEQEKTASSQALASAQNTPTLEQVETKQTGDTLSKAPEPAEKKNEAQVPKEDKNASIKTATDTAPVSATSTSEPTSTRALPSSSSGAKWLAVGSLLLAGTAVTCSAFMWQQVGELGQKLQTLPVAGETTNASHLATITAALDAANKQNQALASEVGNFKNSLQNVQTQLDQLSREALQASQQSDSNTAPQVDMLPQTIRSLLASAELQVKFSHSVQPLLNTLASIENQLKASDTNKYAALIQAIETDIANIRTSFVSDPAKTAEGINALIEQVNQDSNLLVVRTLTQPSAPETNAEISVDLSDAPTVEDLTTKDSAWESVKDAAGWTAGKVSEAGSSVWSWFESTIEFTPHDPDGRKIVLSHSEGAVLRENIKLRLMAARISVRQGEYEQANKELLDVSKTIETYFDQDKAQPILQRLASLSAELKDVSFPSPVRTLSALDALQSHR